RFLGFAKRPEYLEHWNWFDQRLNYSRGEYEKVQEWLNNSPEPSPQSCEQVKFSLNETDENESEEEDEEEVKSVMEADTDTKSTMNDNRKKLFREFLRKRLRKFGLTKTCDKIREVVLTSLSHALLALQIDKCQKSAIKQLTDYHLIPLHHKCREMIQTFYHDEESVKFGVQSEAFTRLGLPSYRPLFIYLNNVILELMHLCVEMQNENKGAINQHLESKFSLLSIEVLTNECRECIEQAILVRQFYYHMIYSVFDLNEMDVQQQLEKDLYKFDDDLKRTISIYLDFITNWVQDLVRVSNFPKALWVLDNEWNFCKNNLYFVTATEDIYASRFCNMGIHVYESLIDMFNIIDNKYKEPLRIEIDSLFWDERYRSVGVDLSLSLSFSVAQPSADSDEDRQEDEFLTRQTSCSSNEKLNLNFNEFKEEINKFRKFCLRTLDFTAEFLADLELAAKYELTHDLQTLLDKLYTTNHVLVNFTNQELLNDSSERSFLIFVPQEFAKDKIQIVRLLFIISEKDTYEAKEANVKPKSGTSEAVRRLSSSNSIFDPFADDQRDSVLRKLSEFAQKMGPAFSAGSSPVSKEQAQKNTFIISPSHNTNGYLLYLKLNEPKEKWNWRGQKIDLHASRPVRLSLYHHLKPNALDSSKKILYLITSKQSVLMEKKINVKQKLQVKAVCGVSIHISYACALLCDALQQFSGKTFWALVCALRVRHNSIKQLR
ncbi:mitogen-activated kinase kinase kinase 4 isoform X4, partial [Brachionus plicatilis]